MSKNFLVILLVLFFTLSNTISKEYEIHPIIIDRIEYSRSSSIYNDIRKIGNKIYIFTCDKGKGDAASLSGNLSKIIQLDNNYNVIDKYKVKNNFTYRSYDWTNKDYYINEKGNIVHNIFVYNKEIQGKIPNSIIKVYDFKENLLREIGVGKEIFAMYFIEDQGMVYYIDVFRGADQYDIGDFNIFDGKISKRISKLRSDFIGLDSLYLYTYIWHNLNVLLFDKKELNIQKISKVVKIVDISPFFYRKTNLMGYGQESRSGDISDTYVKNNIFYQIRFLASSKYLNYIIDKAKKNNLSTTGFENSSVNAFLSTFSETTQTVIIGVDLDNPRLVKEIKINYSQRKVAEAPNSYTVDDEGNIYILDSNNKNIIKVDKDAYKVEIDYKYEVKREGNFFDKLFK